jgi:hypothetical protein
MYACMHVCLCVCMFVYMCYMYHHEEAVKKQDSLGAVVGLLAPTTRHEGAHSVFNSSTLVVIGADLEAQSDLLLAVVDDGLKTAGG